MDGTFVPFTWGEPLLSLGARKIKLRPERSQPAAHHAQIKEYIKYDHSNGNAAQNPGCSPPRYWFPLCPGFLDLKNWEKNAAKYTD